MTAYDYIKNVFWVLIILSIAPALITNITKQYGKYFERRARVGIIPIKNVIYDSTNYCKQLRLFFEDKSIKALLIKMECPGGASGTAQIIANELLALKKINPKPVIVFVENMCASGGYNIAAAADYIISPASALIGSIGSSMPYLFNINKLIGHYNVDYTPIAAGKYKNAANPFAPLNKDDIKLLQGVADDCYQQFLLDISQYRKLPLEKAHEWGDAKIFTGRQALKLGLIDELGSLDTAINVIRKKALIDETTKIEWVKVPKRKTFWSFLGGDDDFGSDDDTVLSSFASTLCDKLEERFMHSTTHKMQ